MRRFWNCFPFRTSPQRTQRAQKRNESRIPSVNSVNSVVNSLDYRRGLHRWIKLAQERVAFQGLPARICWLGQGERAQFGCALNELVKRGEIGAPVVIGR